MKKKVCMIMGGVMPVPAVCGGAIETLVNSIVRQYSKDDDFELTICSVYHSEAVKEAEKYPDVRFFWTHTNSFWNLCKHSLFLIIRQLKVGLMMLKILIGQIIRYHLQSLWMLMGKRN